MVFVYCTKYMNIIYMNTYYIKLYLGDIAYTSDTWNVHITD